MREVLENPTLEGMSNIISQKEHSIQKMQKTSMSKYIHKYNETENAPVKVISFFHAGTGRLIDYKHMVENLLDKDMSDTQLIGFTYGEYQQYMEETNLCPIKTSIICKILLYKNWIFNIIGINRLLFFINPYKIIHLDKKYQYSMEERDILE